MTTHVAKGRVFLIGAGPGDPGMLTLRGRDLLARADVVVYDYLVNADILDHARHDAELICRGRHGQGPLLDQQEINQAMVSAGLAGKMVARLKGGDPGVFGHLAEEIDALEAAGLSYEIIPGITAALAAASYAGVPLTDRDHASAVALVTGQERPDQAESKLDADLLARFPGTLVYYMGVTTAGHWSGQLMASGKPPDTPVAVIRRVSWPDQHTWRCRLDEVAALLDQRRSDKIRPPVLVVVGEAARDFGRGSWFTDRPLFGQTILVTRPAEQGLSLRDTLRELGARVLLQPAIEIGPPNNWTAVDKSLQRLNKFDWIVFSSQSGVEWYLRRLMVMGGDLRSLGPVKIAAVGTATDHALAAWNLRADLVPQTHRAENLADAVAARMPPGARVLLVRASRGREVLLDRLVDAGAHVTQVAAYSSRDCQTVAPDIAEALSEGQIDWVTVTSSAIARSLATLLGESLRRAKLVSISPITTGVLQELGYSVAAEAQEFTMDGVVQALLSACQANSEEAPSGRAAKLDPSD
jgi:uroporphyrinogen III methyltransferase/synthase